MIEINWANSPFIFRQNPFNPRIIDVRPNKHGGRWKPYDSFPTEEEARAEMLHLRSKNERNESENTNGPGGPVSNGSL